MFTLTQALITAIVGLITYILGWTLQKRKVAVQAESTELDNVEKAIKIWREFSEDITQKHNDLQKMYDQLYQKYVFLEGEYKTAKENEHKCLIEIQLLKDQISTLQKQLSHI